MYDYVLYQLALAHLDALRREAERYRLVQQAAPQRALRRWLAGSLRQLAERLEPSLAA